MKMLVFQDNIYREQETTLFLKEEEHQRRSSLPGGIQPQ
jgi:hypothetical protein